MAQFDLCKNASARLADEVPFLLILQSDLLEGSGQVVVAPVWRRLTFGRLLRGLHPTFTLGGQSLVVEIPALAAISKSAVGEVVTNMSSKRAGFIGALDLLFTGA